MMGSVWAWLTAVAWASQAVLIRTVVRAVSPVDVFVVAGLVAGGMASIVMAVRLLGGRPLWQMTLADTVLLSGAEVLGVLGLASFFVGVKEVGLARAAGVSSAYPALAALFAWAVLGEAPTMVQMIGLLVAGVGVALVQAGS